MIPCILTTFMSSNHIYPSFHAGADDGCQLWLPVVVCAQPAGHCFCNMWHRSLLPVCGSLFAQLEACLAQPWSEGLQDLPLTHACLPGCEVDFKPVAMVTLHLTRRSCCAGPSTKPGTCLHRAGLTAAELPPPECLMAHRQFFCLQRYLGDPQAVQQVRQPTYHSCAAS